MVLRLFCGSISVACVALIYLHARAAFSACLLPLSQCMLAIIPLMGDLSSLLGDQTLQWLL